MHKAPAALNQFARINRSLSSRLAPSSSTIGAIARMMQTPTITPYARPNAAMSMLSSSASMANAREVTRLMQTLRIAPHVGRNAGMTFLSSPAFARARDVARISDISFLSRTIGSAGVREAHRLTAMSLLSSSAHAKLMRQHVNALAPKMAPRFPVPRVHHSSPHLKAVPLRNPWGDVCPVCEHNEHVADEFDREPDGNIGFRLGRFQQTD